MNLSELLSESSRGDEPFLAYTIFWAMQKGLVTGSDRFEKLGSIELKIEEIKELQNQNMLGIESVKLYSMPFGNKEFLFVFAKNEKDARGVFFSQFGRFPERIADATSRMYSTMWDAENGYETFRQMKDRILSFPAIATTYQIDSRSVEQVEYEYTQMFGKSLRILEG